MLEIIKSIPIVAYVALFTAIFTAGVTLLGVHLTNLSNDRRLKIQLEHERAVKEEERLNERRFLDMIAQPQPRSIST